MSIRFKKLPGWLARRADNVAVLLLSGTFIIFVLQIVSRYVFRQPLGWTLEACLLCWLWLVFWSGAFTLKDQDHVRFTILIDSARPGMRRIFSFLSGVCIIAAFGVALWPTTDFVQFMSIESTSLLKIRFDIVFGIYLVFTIAIICRYLKRCWQAVKGADIS
ncbi:MAG: TRAP transporter small permease [Granulosicoccus sp.]